MDRGSRNGTDRHRTARPPCALAAVVGTLLLLLGATASAARVVGDQNSTRAARPALTATLTASIPDTSAENASEPRIVLYGDSLSSESQGYFAEFLIRNGITDVQTRAYGGMALCDYLGAMRQDAAVLHPTTVVIEFSGNAFTPCMRNADGTPPTGEEWLARYRDAATEALRIFAPSGTHVYFVGTPLSRRAEGDPNANLLNNLYASLSKLGLSTYVDAGAAVLDHGHWTETLPCRSDEPCEGPTDSNGIPTNVVRAPDGGHFCPGAPDAVRGVTAGCPVWSSGAFRFGSAMAAPVVQAVSAERQ